MSHSQTFSLGGMKIAVLMGGPGSEREVSLRSGAAVAEALGRIGALVHEVDVRDEHFKLPPTTELAFNMLHGTFGEDGQVQEVLDRRGVRYTGEGPRGSRVAFDKILSKECFDQHGVATPEWEKIQDGAKPGMEPPYVIKAPRQGSSLGIAIVHEVKSLPAALEACYVYDRELLVEKFFSGRELTVGILGRSALPVIEIVPKNGFYDYEHKYTKGGSEYFVPAPLTPAETAAVRDAAVRAHQALGLEVYSRVDVILNPGGDLTVLEINTIPGMTETSLLPKAAAAVGVDFTGLCTRIARLSLARYR